MGAGYEERNGQSDRSQEGIRGVQGEALVGTEQLVRTSYQTRLRRVNFVKSNQMTLYMWLE
jgi:hypothetical protein